VTVNVTLSCDTANVAGTLVVLQNISIPDSSRQAILDITGTFTFINLWAGTYSLTVSKFGYQTFTQTPVNLLTNVTLNAQLEQIITVPAGLHVFDTAALATWFAPVFSGILFSEDWSSGGFIANQWTVDPASYWTVSSTEGNPAPSAQFLEQGCTNCEYSLTSRTIPGNSSPFLELRYDIHLYSYAGSQVLQLSVELWDGTTWHSLRTYNNHGGSIPWKTEVLDISAYTLDNFRIRFRCAGDLPCNDYWNVDNIVVEATDEPARMHCVSGYKFYLDTVLLGTTPDTFYHIPQTHLQYGHTYTACVSAVYPNGLSSQTCYPFISHFLYPPLNIRVDSVEDAAYITWEKPVIGDAIYTTPAGLTGYNVYRNGQLIHYAPDPDTLSYWDLHLNEGNYCYDVTARYDLSTYGFPGIFGESEPAVNGPACIGIISCLCFPFFEPWDQGSFSFHQWQHSGNWTINTSTGNPAPAADFIPGPVLSNYNCSLVSPTMGATAFTCTDIWCDFDLKLVDNISTGNEKLDLDIYSDNAWITRAEYSNTGTTGWVSHHINIHPVQGQNFRIRFVAKGNLSSDIQHWYVDNINVYGVCHGPQDLSGSNSQFTTTLSWNPPDCSPSGSTPQWIRWDNDTNFTSIGYNAPHIFEIAARWTPDQMGSFDNCVITHIRFWPSGAGVATYKVRIWQGANASSLVVDQEVPSFFTDQWNEVTLNLPLGVDITKELWIGAQVTEASGYPAGCDAGPAVAGYGDMINDGTGWVAMSLPPNNYNYNWNFQAYLEPSKKKTVLASSLVGYNVYRTPDNAITPFNLLNTTPVPGPTYADVHSSSTGVNTTWLYYVAAVFENSVLPGLTICEGASDTIPIVFPAVGFNNPDHPGYPYHQGGRGNQLCRPDGLQQVRYNSEQSHDECFDMECRRLLCEGYHHRWCKNHKDHGGILINIRNARKRLSHSGRAFFFLIFAGHDLSQ
jgi:hypothetical protein